MIPIGLQLVHQIAEHHDLLIGLREKLDELNSQAQTATLSVKKLYGNVIEEMDVLLNTMRTNIEQTVVPPTEYSNFLIGLNTLDEWMDFDSLQYYNGLRELQFLLYGFRAAFLGIQDAPVQSNQAGILGPTTPGVLDSITEEEFVDQGFKSPAMEVTPDYLYYTIRQGDSLQKIALRTLTDATRIMDVARASNITEDDLINNSRIGETIRIPSDTAALARQRETNLVYERYADQITQRFLDRFFYGRDLALPDRRLQVDTHGDLAVIEGVQCVLENIRDRFHNVKGSLNPQTPNWGLTRLTDRGRMPFALFLDLLFSDMEGQALSDGRVVGANVNRRTFKIVRDALFVSMKIVLSGGQVETITVENPQKTIL